MATPAKNQEKVGLSPFDRIKWFAVILIVIGGIWGNWQFDEFSVFYRALGLVALAVICVFIALQTEMGRNLWTLMRDARSEIRRVIWPTRPETVQTTAIVLILILVFALILWGLDSFLSWLVQLILR